MRQINHKRELDKNDTFIASTTLNKVTIKKKFFNDFFNQSLFYRIDELHFRYRNPMIGFNFFITCTGNRICTLT